MAPRLKDDNIFGDLVRDPVLQFKQDDPVLVTLAACHTLTRIEGEIRALNFGLHFVAKFILFSRSIDR